MGISLPDWVETLSYLQIASFPVIAALVGWATNWLAVQLTFYPVERMGFGSVLAWQGVIPKNAEKMASISVDRTIDRFGDMHDVFMRLEPEKITHQILRQIIPRVEEYIDEIMYEHHDVLWDNLPFALRERVYEWARRQLPGRVEALVAEFGDELGELVDLKELLITDLKLHPDLMVRIFQEAGDKEFQFIIKSGLFLGFLMGCIVLPVWASYPSIWTLLGAGFVIGWATNWIAINLIFRPVNPRNVFGYRLQGLFLKRQKEVAAVWSKLIADELITVERVAWYMIYGRHGMRTRSIIQKNMRPALDQSGTIKLIAQLTVGANGYAELKKALHDKAVSVSVVPFHDPEFNRDRAPIVAAEIERRMAALRPAEFQDVLRPAFQEEEWQLMFIGGCLGALAGLIQWGMFFT